MTQAKGATETWAELYEAFSDQGERLTDEIDRLAADLKDSKTLTKASATMLRQMNELAAAHAARGQELVQHLAHARAIADDAGKHAAASLTLQAQETSARVVGRLDSAAAAVDEAVRSLRRTAGFTRVWGLVCAVAALAGMAAGAGAMYWLLQRPPSEQDQYLRYQGALLGRMTEGASKKELAVLNTLRQREEARWRKEAAPVQ